jgi:hypothetical protein
MFGRRAKGQPDHEEEVEVDVTLEQDISVVEQAVDSYLQGPNDSLRQDLLTALEQLDDRIEESDAYHARLTYPFVGPDSSVVGATNASSIPEDVSSTEFQAQVALVKAAKSVVKSLTPDTLADLRAANDALATLRSMPDR